jgi:homoprotocatechuate degradation regulator HpaR
MNPFAHRNLPRLLLHARETVLAHFRPALRSHGLTDQQWRVLRVLAERGASDVSTIAQEAFLLGPSLTGVLARMERDGLVVRDRDATDARRQIVRASPAGLRLARKLAESIEAHYKHMEGTLGQKQLQQLYDLLDQVIAMPAQAQVAPVARKRTKRAS